MGEGSASRPGRSLTPGNTRYPLYRRLGGPAGPVWTCAWNLASHRDSIPGPSSPYPVAVPTELPGARIGRCTAPHLVTNLLFLVRAGFRKRNLWTVISHVKYILDTWVVSLVLRFGEEHLCVHCWIIPWWWRNYISPKQRHLFNPGQGGGAVPWVTTILTRSDLFSLFTNASFEVSIPFSLLRFWNSWTPLIRINWDGEPSG